jgi:hypothetical protein
MAAFVPIIGGGAAIEEGKNMGDVFPFAEEVVLLAVTEGEFETESFNIYDQTGIDLSVHKTSDREFDRIKVLPDGKWIDSTDFYDEQRKLRGIAPDDFESLTFHDANGRNIHCSIKNNKIQTGANLPDNGILKLCTIDRRAATQRVSEFISKERSLIIGCAGIRSLILEPLLTGKNSLCGFLFGEIVSCNNNYLFGNLMLSRLTRK